MRTLCLPAKEVQKLDKKSFKTMGKNGEMSMKDSNSEDGRDGRDRSRSPMRKREPRRDWDREHRGSGMRSGMSPGVNNRGGATQHRPRIYIANIPYDMRWQEVKDLFKEKVSDVTYVDLFEDNEGKSIGAGIVEFREAEAADKAIEEMNRYELRGRRIIVREERESDRRRREKMLRDQHMGGDMGMPMGGGGGGGGGMGMLPSMSGGGGPSMSPHMGSGGLHGGPGGMSGPMGIGGAAGAGRGMMDFPNNSGIPTPLLQQLGIDGPVTNQLFVANLEYSVNCKKLQEIFTMAGKVVDTEIKMDKEGKSKGFGTVTFETPLEAVQAISMFNGQMLYDRPMSVRMDKEAQTHREPSKPKLPGGLRGIGMGLGSSGQALLGNQLQSLGNASSNNGQNMLNNLNSVGMGLGLSGLSGLSNLAGGALSGANLSSSGGSGGAGGLADLGMTGGLSGLSGNLSNLSSNLAGSLASFNSSSGGLASGLNLANMGLSGLGGGAGGDGMVGGSGGGHAIRDQPMRGGSGNRSMQMDDTSIFVRNIPHSYTWKDLKDLFMDIGEVKYAAVKMENGKSKGCGTVRFTSADDARRAVNFMNGYRLQGRSLEVFVDRK